MVEGEFNMSMYTNQNPAESVGNVAKTEAKNTAEEKKMQLLLERAVDMVGQKAWVKVFGEYKMCEVTNVDFLGKKVGYKFLNNEDTAKNKTTVERHSLGVRTFWDDQRECRLVNPDLYATKYDIKNNRVREWADRMLEPADGQKRGVLTVQVSGHKHQAFNYRAINNGKYFLVTYDENSGLPGVVDDVSELPGKNESTRTEMFSVGDLYQWNTGDLTNIETSSLKVVPKAVSKGPRVIESGGSDVTYTGDDEIAGTSEPVVLPKRNATVVGKKGIRAAGSLTDRLTHDIDVMEFLRERKRETDDVSQQKAA